MAEDNGNGRAQKQRRGRKTARPRYKAKPPEQMEADDAVADRLLTQAGLDGETERMLQAQADIAASGNLTLRDSIEQKQRVLHSAELYGLNAMLFGLKAASRRQAGAEYATAVALSESQREMQSNE